MKILMCHNHYQLAGGEDRVFADEVDVLRRHGHDVVEYVRHNDEINTLSLARTAAETVWSRRTSRQLADLLRRERPDIMHCANTFPLISPSAYYTARKRDVAVVQTLHNYRLLCPMARFTRDDQVCTDCAGRALAWPAVRHGCYRDSRSASATVAAMVSMHRLLGTWRRQVDCYIALTEFSRQLFVENGLPAERVVVKPNFVRHDPGQGAGEGEFAVFVGRLSREKGVHVLLEAWKRYGGGYGLKIVGDGPQRDEVQVAAANDQRIEWVGWKSPEEVKQIVGAARCLIMPSIWFETFGLTIIEAFAVGTPVVASQLGAMQELVDDGRNGRLFEPGDAAGLAACVADLCDSPIDRSPMRQAARQEFEQRYNAQVGYENLLAVYRHALRMANGHQNQATGGDRRPVNPQAEFKS